MSRIDQRENNQLRKVDIEMGVNNYAEGSALVQFGNTKVLCLASVEGHLPKWLQGQERGWVTAEYGMLPRSTHERMRRSKTSESGRSQEISRLIARSLRSCVDLYALKDQSITIDCDVIQADGGTRTAAITGGFVALAQAIHYLNEKKLLKKFPLKNFTSAVSIGVVENQVLTDLCYQEDVNAETDANFVINSNKGIIEIQGTAEERDFSRDQLNEMLDHAMTSCQELHSIQKQTLSSLGLEVLMEKN